MTLSTVDVGQSDNEWSCEPLSVEDVLEEGEKFAYYTTRVLYYLRDLP